MQSATVDVNALDATYLARKKSVKLGTVTLASGRTFAYFEDGDQSAKKTVVCIHGGLQSMWCWLLKEPVPDARLISVARAGYGNGSSKQLGWRSFKTGGFERLLADFVDFFDQLQLQRFFLVGWSYGSNYAQQLAAMLPDRVKGVGLVGVGVDPYYLGVPPIVSHNMKYDGLVPKVFQSDCARGHFLRALVRYQMGPTRIKDAAAYLAARRAKRPHVPEWERLCADPFESSKLKDSGHLSFTDYSGSEPEHFVFRAVPWPYDVATIQCPVHIWHGRLDDTHLVGAAEWLATVIPGAKLKILENADHYTPVFGRPAAELIRAVISS